MHSSEYYHFSSWDPGKIDFNMVYETNWIKSNYWTQKCIDNYSYTEKQELVELFELINSTFSNRISPESIVQMKKVFNSSMYLSELLKEYIFEEVRLEEFYECPSRKKCMFLVPKDNDPKAYSEILGFNSNKLNFYKVEIIQADKILHADFSYLNCNGSDYKEKVEYAQKYWSGDIKSRNCVEVLFEGKFKLTHINN